VIPEVEALSYRAAGQRISRNVRTVRRLVAAGDLQTVGEGQKRKITVASIREYARKSDMSAVCPQTVSAVGCDNGTVEQLNIAVCRIETAVRRFEELVGRLEKDGR
jgi:hypothetical protein